MGGLLSVFFFFARDFMSIAFADFNQSLKEVCDGYFVPYDAFRKWSVCVWLVFGAYLGGFGVLRGVWELLGFGLGQVLEIFGRFYCVFNGFLDVFGMCLGGV